MTTKASIFWPAAFFVLVADYLTKAIIHSRLTTFQSIEVLGDFLRFTLSYNTGAAFGFSLFQSRWVYVGLTIIILGVLYSMYKDARSEDRWQALALGLIVGGALGNMVDRVRWTRGVVDFIDVGIGTSRFWTFNIADAGISVGAVSMVIIFLLQARRARHAASE